MAMNGLLTDNPSNWKDWVIEQMCLIEDEIGNDSGKVHSIGIVIIPEDLRKDNAMTAFYNAEYIDRLLMSQHMHFDVVDMFVGANMEKYVCDCDITFTPDSGDSNVDSEVDSEVDSDYSENT